MAALSKYPVLISYFMPSSQLPISIIVPVGSSPASLTPLLSALSAGNVFPSEILLVDALGNLALHSEELQALLSSFPSTFACLVTTIYSKDPLLPGEARNLGFRHSSFELIGFLDVSTIPDLHWLSTAYNRHSQTRLPIIYGSTQYIPRNYQQLLAATVTYGLYPTLTLPGSLTSRSFFTSVGLFLPSIRAGEDTDWLLRSFNFTPRILSLDSVPLQYSNIPSTLSSLLRKWHRNYSSCSAVVFHLERQKSYYFFFVILVLLLLAYQWNSVFANWNEDSFLYFANITKFSLVAVILFYVSVRVVLRSIRKGANLAFVFLSLVPLIMYSILIDLTKLVAFLFPERRHTPVS